MSPINEQRHSVDHLQEGPPILFLWQKMEDNKTTNSLDNFRLHGIAEFFSPNRHFFSRTKSTVVVFAIISYCRKKLYSTERGSIIWTPTVEVKTRWVRLHWMGNESQSCAKDPRTVSLRSILTYCHVSNPCLQNTCSCRVSLKTVTTQLGQQLAHCLSWAGRHNLGRHKIIVASYCILTS